MFGCDFLIGFTLNRRSRMFWLGLLMGLARFASINSQKCDASGLDCEEANLGRNLRTTIEQHFAFEESTQAVATVRSGLTSFGIQRAEVELLAKTGLPQNSHNLRGWIETRSGGVGDILEEGFRSQLHGAVKFTVMQWTYVKNGKEEALYTAEPFPITMEVERIYPGRIILMLAAINTIVHDITYNMADGRVLRNFRSVATRLDVNPDQMATEMKIGLILDALEQVVLDWGEVLRFIANNGRDVIAFSTDVGKDPSRPHDPSHSSGSTTWTVLPKTYMKDGMPSALFTASTFPITLEIKTPCRGTMLLTWSGVNNGTYDVAFNEADGRVLTVTQVASTWVSGSQHEMATEAKLREIFGNLESVLFGPNGTVEFMYNQGRNKVSFKRQQLRRSMSHPSYFAETRQVNGDTYMKAGEITPLFSGAPFPISVEMRNPYPGKLWVILKAGTTVKYDISYNGSDVSVTRKTEISGASVHLTQDEAATETKLKEIFDNLQQVVLETDGSIQFIADYGLNRISFQPPADPQQNTEYRSVVPETYFEGGKFRPLYTSTVFPIMVETVQPERGKIIVTLKAVNTVNYSIDFYNADGRVSHIVQTSSTDIKEPLQNIAAEDRIRSIIGNVQQLAFEKDGTLQFITDYGKTRISFRPLAS